ncbi:MAG: glutaredoxin family protein [Pseudomonadota bacterium]
MRTILLCGLLVCAAGAAAEGLYRWVDAAGKVHYGDVPAEQAAQVQRKKFDAPSSDAVQSAEARRVRDKFPVTLYVTSNCTEPCQQSRDFLTRRAIPYTETLLQTSEEFEAFKRKSGSEGVPTVSIGKNYLKGFQAEQWGSALDIAGYTKNAPLLPPAKPPAPKAPDVLPGDAQ